MLCDICKKNDATVHLTQIVEGKMLKVDVCELCAKAKGVHDTEGFSPSDLLLGLGAAEEMKIEGGGVRCATCGFTQADFKKTGRLGCSACWETFVEGLGSLLKAMHKGDHHVGKVPSRAAHSIVLSEKIRGLTDELDQAVRSEKRAAVVLRGRAETMHTVHVLVSVSMEGSTPHRAEVRALEEVREALVRQKLKHCKAVSAKVISRRA